MDRNKPPKRPPQPERPDRLENIQIEGRNPVIEALKGGTPIDKILMRRGEHDGSLRVIAAMARERGVVVAEADRTKLDFMSRTASHQGVIAVCPAHEYAEVEDIFARASDRGEQPFIIIPDGITDPHNLGAIIRSAEASGAHGVIIPKRRSSGLTAVVSKTAAGALSHIPVARVANTVRAVEDLKKQGVWTACADMKGESMYGAPLEGPIALIIGGEGEGVSRLLGETCDFRVSIPMFGRISSLNASVAAGILMYEVVRRRRFASK